MSSVDESVTTLALLRSLLDEVGRRNPSRDSRSPPTLRLQILRRLRKEAANGNAGAFELLASLKRAMPAALRAMQDSQAESKLGGGSWLVPGGVISVPFDQDLDEVRRQVNDCHTDAELSQLLSDLSGVVMYAQRV